MPIFSSKANFADLGRQGYKSRDFRGNSRLHTTATGVRTRSSNVVLWTVGSHSFHELSRLAYHLKNISDTTVLMNIPDRTFGRHLDFWTIDSEAGGFRNQESGH